ncbi:MAG: hypothetical protein ACOX08_10000 [Methanobacterium sp.]|jgi:hypothetical protein|uniref:hypothetical protein n=1 Tax=Methanobacterium sp. MZD130B TaxID=3394378 RepID=UPI0039FDAA53
MDSFVCSEFFPYIEFGTEIKKGVFCQDLENLTFTNKSFDLIITEDDLGCVKDLKGDLRNLG